MSKPRKNERIRCTHFTWKLHLRSGVWHADGRSNTPNVGRHSLGTKDRTQALQLLAALDQQRATELGLAPRSNSTESPAEALPLAKGRQLYEEHISRPRVVGGVRASTKKKYRSVFDKFLPFAIGCGITTWNGVTADLLVAYVAHLEKQEYAHKSLCSELVTIKQAIKWLISQGLLTGLKPIELAIHKAEGERAYCYRAEEVLAMIDHCQATDRLHWLADVIVALACTGLRISELVSLRWTDLNFETGRLYLTDETGRAVVKGHKRRELKSGRSRSFPIHQDLMAVLRKLPRAGAHVFHGPRGGRLEDDTVRRILIRKVITPLADKFPTPHGARGFKDGRLHSFRHYFCSVCANSGVPERMVMEWLGHQDSEMVRHYYHLHDDEARHRMAKLDFVGGGRGVAPVQT